MEPPSETLVCGVCAHENPLDAYFCVECGTPISATCNLNPYHRIFSEGHLYRKAAMGRPRLIAVLGMWAIFLPGLLIFPLGLLQQVLSPEGPAYGYLLGGFAWIVGIVILYRVTANYRKKRALESSSAPQQESSG
jgi:hypothetical protein